jgi:hypothetical protein
MAHKQLEDGRVVVDWTTGDPEGDRITLLKAYMDFIDELWNEAGGLPIVEDIFDKWNINTDNQVDEVPRIWIKRPE